MRFTDILGLFLAGAASGCMMSEAKMAAPPVDPTHAAAPSDGKPPGPPESKEPEIGKDADKKKAEEKPKLGDEVGDAFGEGGLGLTGTGPGGGGSGDGVGIGGLGTIGRGGGTGTGSGYGSGAGGGGRSGAKGHVGAATATTSGTGLATDVIARVVRRGVNQIQYCYEKAMEKAPTLAGKVAVKFVIDAQGAVTSATAADTNITDADMVSCVCAAVKRMSFPAPDGGGAMIVTYPFNFSPGDP